jgi:hypothetical protein
MRQYCEVVLPGKTGLQLKWIGIRSEQFKRVSCEVWRGATDGYAGDYAGQTARRTLVITTEFVRHGEAFG